ncbi:MAG: CPBP family intramembrane metalloprotease [Bacteroidales bacterium]|nr:MAG: CPBP family intramembrane metalloprotease [Bacteroidales bacterium]
MNIPLKNILRFIEFIILFFGIPLFIYFDPNIIHPSIVILPILVVIFLYLKRLKNFRFRELIELKIKKQTVLIHSLIILVTSLILVLAVYLFDRNNLFNLPKSNPLIYIMLCVFYPAFSAYGQEIIYRTFLFYRYQAIFKSKLSLILASSIAFSFMHIVYYSHISIILTFILGLYLSFTYLKTRSVLLTTIIHGIFGDIIFTIGLGGYFWLDMHQWM